MQTPKTRTNSLEVPQRKSPATPRTARKLKIPGSESDSMSASPNTNSRTPKERNLKAVERRSPQSPASEKKRPSRVSELESQLSQLQEELKKVKDQLNASESGRRQAQQESDEARKQLVALSEKLEESQQQLLDLSASDDARVQELRKISQDRDRAWQSELEAIQKQHSLDSAALASAMNEIKRLKGQLEIVAESEMTQTKHAESAHNEIQRLRIELSETLDLVEKLKTDLNDCRESEAQALEIVSNTQKQLEAANATADSLRSDSMKVMETYKSLSVELEQSRARANELENLVNKLQADLADAQAKSTTDNSSTTAVSREERGEEINRLISDLDSVRLEASQLRSALDAAEVRYKDEYIQSTLQIRNAFELVESTKLESCQKQADLEAELKISTARIEDLSTKLADKDAKLQSIAEENCELNFTIKKSQATGTEKECELMAELERLQADLAEFKAMLLDKETELQNLTEENQVLKMEMNRRDTESNKVNSEALASADTARAAEREALMKLGYLTEEADKSSRRAAYVSEQLDAAQAANSEMEAELRRLKVQADQWRKAAEAAAAMLSSGNNGKLVERTGSMDNYSKPISGITGSPCSEDMDEESPMKKNGNMLKKFGLWKKGQK